MHSYFHEHPKNVIHLLNSMTMSKYNIKKMQFQYHVQMKYIQQKF